MTRPLPPGVLGSAQFEVGVRVSWIDALGNTRFGTVDEIDETGRVYVAEARTNNRGKTVISACWFDAHEAHRLTVSVTGPIPITFEVVRWEHPNRVNEWLLRWTMQVPDRVTGKIEPVTFQNKLPDARTPQLKRKMIRQCVLGAFQHEALESIFIDGERAFDPHKERWYSNLVADWRCVP